MKIQILSDLHIEFGNWVPPATDADVVVLAGDVHVKGRGIAWALQSFTKPVVFVAGNHDFYGGNLKKTLEKMQAAALGTNVHVLHDSAVVLDGVRFVGGTLWTDYRLTGNQPLAQWDAQQTLADFKHIRDENYSKAHAHQFVARHARTRAFIQGQLEEPFEGKTVVVTHHAPSELSVHPRYRDTGGHLSAAFASRLDHMMGDHLPLWIHGHTHDSFDYEVYGTRVVCNPRGYAPDDFNENFNEALIIEV